MTEWINVQDRLPMPEIPKLIYCEESEYGFVDGVLIGIYKSYNKTWMVKCGCTGYECDPDFPIVTHWAELPNAPND